MNESVVPDVDSLRKCPICGGELEKGIINLRSTGPCDLVFWDMNDKMEKLIPTEWTLHDRPGWRCNKCQLAIIFYGKQGVKP